VRSLIDPEYDVKSVKHAWLNGCLNASPMQDFNESSLRLYRVELRGSYLYIYRPPLLMNVLLFKLDPQLPAPNAGMTSELETATISASYQRSVIPSDKISHFLPNFPHPELKFNTTSETFAPSCPIEALVHYFIFADGQVHGMAIRQLSLVFPLLPNFADVLKLMETYLQAIFSGSFDNYQPGADLFERILTLLKHIDKHLSGFLLKADVAPYILKLLQLVGSASPVEFLDIITQIQDSIVKKQLTLLDLIGSVDSTPRSSVLNESIFDELSAHRFLHKFNLLDLVTAISDIDLLFYESWNSSTDKSLLLSTSMDENNPGDYFYKKNPLVFNNETHLHYLSRLLVNHLFVENLHSTTDIKARILERWIDLGCLLDKFGNMSSWLGISSIILSQPILRLKDVWSQVGEDYIKLLKNDWSPILYELDQRCFVHTTNVLLSDAQSNGLLPVFKESYHIMAPRGLGKIFPKEKVVPYFGDLLVNNTNLANIAELENVWKKITHSFERWNEYLSNLSNSQDIISYNQDVLRRYDSMGFMFSNESLNQVLYLGVNKEDGKITPLVPKLPAPEIATDPIDGTKIQDELRRKLLCLLELNCDSISLSTVMSHSLRMEPSLKEGYLNLPDKGIFDVFLKDDLKEIFSPLSIDSGISMASRSTPEVDDTSIRNQTSSKTDSSFKDKLPTFNLQYYKIDVSKYDDLLSHLRDRAEDTRESHDIFVDSDLVLRLDDFINDFENTVTPTTSTGEITQSTDNDDGLGIDVEELMNSEKFKTLSSLSDSESTDGISTKRKHCSFGLVSRHSYLGSHRHSQNYIPRFATMDKLIDLLLLDSKYLDETHLIDLTEYRFVFMLNYSSFITTKELLERLSHRFIHSGNAVISVMRRLFMQKQGIWDPVSFGAFPNWNSDNSVDLSQLGEVDYKLLLEIQANILKVLLILLSHFFECFLNDLHNKTIMIKILKLYSNEILQWYNSNKIDDTLNESYENLVGLYKRLKSNFIKKTYRPLKMLKFDLLLSQDFEFSRSVREVPMNRNLPSHKNFHKVEKFIIKFNKLLAIFYQGITPENWFAIFKILENQFANSTLLNYDIQTAGTSEKNLRVSDVFTYLESLFETDAHEKVLNKFPLVFKKLYSLYQKFKAYLLIQICDEGLGDEERLERMKTLLLMITISRLKMRDSVFVFEGDREFVPSCVETAITSIMYSPESRSLAHFWLNASSGSNISVQNPSLAVDGIESLLPKHIKHSDLSAASEPLLPCFGWIIQNLIHLNECPSFHRSAINFNKRYFLYRLIRELNVEELKSNELQRDTKDFEFLFQLDERRVLGNLGNIDLSSTKLLFDTILKEQYSINIRDEQNRSTGHGISTLSNERMHATQTPSSTNLRRQSLSYKTASSSRFKISGLFNKSRSFGHTGGYERVTTYKELPDPITVADPRQKPLLVIRLKDRKIFPVYLLPYCFKFDSHNAHEACFFQASSETDAKSWLRSLNYANRHWFLSKSINLKSDHSHTTFGIPLATICARDGLASPAILASIYEVIEKDCLKEVGIYRISTSLSELSALKQEINRTGVINFRNRTVDVHTLTSCVKSFFRELPDALLTDQVIEMLCALRRTSNKEDGLTKNDVLALRKIFSTLPRENYCTLRALVRHLSVVVQQNESNKMTCSNLATVIGPALTEASNLETLMNNFGVINHVLEMLIESYQLIFD
ncbi:hypothetical protein METBIDRAFT_24494, partial [Metschnikowia bicuspidata var. bicuspidata NRRL YB-4993]